MAGAEFVRADLHVHTFPDVPGTPNAATVGDYVRTAYERGLGVLGITDHNTTHNVAAAVEAAKGTGLLVLPGIEISTHEGHLLALFAPDQISQLSAFAHTENLKLTQFGQGASEVRSTRSMLDLVDETSHLGGLPIPAHVDASDGIAERMAPTALVELLSHPGLAGLEFATQDALNTWFTDSDSDADRKRAWAARQTIQPLRERGLARVMSSDAHSLEKVGEDRSRRTLTRLRVDDRNFEAVRNALLFNPKARCKAEATLPITYPRVVSAHFKGGFLDGVELEFSGNLSCIIGGRGSGKSTALLAIRAALGVDLSSDDDPDEPERMPEVTRVTFIDRAGSERVAQRMRGESPVEPASGSPVELQLADLGQDESGRLARGYSDDPAALLRFLDGFVDLQEIAARGAELLRDLGENANEVLRTNVSVEELNQAEKEHAGLEASLRAAQTGKVEELARWAGLLAAQAPLLGRIEHAVAAAGAIGAPAPAIDLDALAQEYGVDLNAKPAVDFVEGPDGLRARLVELNQNQTSLRSDAQAALTNAGQAALGRLEEWKLQHKELQERLDRRQRELEAQGLRVQAGAIRELATQLNAVKTRLTDLRQKKAEHDVALRQRKQLLTALWSNRDAAYERRRATLKRIVEVANRTADGLTIHVYFERAGIHRTWIDWLTRTFGFRSPRVQRLAQRISPADFSDALLNNPRSLLSLQDEDGTGFFTQALLDETLATVRTWPQIFELQTMRLDDRPRIEVQEHGSTERRPFDHLSAGQQRSVLLSLLLCAERDEPLILDQPEDHLDAQYIATSVVRHLEAAKEHRQVLIATHSANLTVLGDAELVVPMYAEGRHGAPRDPGAVDRPETRERVCALLEGGEEAYLKRGQRYGLL